MNRLTRIEIENFRGFSDNCLIDLNADSIVVTGPNGTGKTSLIDAITWALIGQVARLEKHKERKNDDVVGNRYRPGATPTVALSLEIDGRAVVVTRSGHAPDLPSVEDGGEVVRGPDAVAQALGFPAHTQLQYALNTWGVLHQDSMRAVLEARPEEFQTRLRDILGLGALGVFETWIKNEHKNASDAAKQARERLAAATATTGAARLSLERSREQVRSSESPTDARAQVARAATDAEPLVMLRMPENSDHTPSILIDETRRLQTEIARHWATYQSLVEAATLAEARVPTDPEQLALATTTATDAYNTAQASLQEAEARLAAFQERLQGLAALAAIALPHLGDHCPVCEQGIDQHAVRHRLEALLDQSADRAALTALEQARDLARTAAQTAEIKMGECVGLERAAREHSQEITRLRAEQEAQVEWFQAIAADDELIPVRIGTPTDDLISSATAHLRRLEGTLAHWQTALRDSALAAQQPALEARLAEAEEREQQARAEVERLAATELNLKGLASAATEAVVDVTRDWLSELSPLFGAVYNRLAAHPTFTELGLEHDIYYGKGRSLPRVYDRLLDISDNPQLVCSEGQLNIVALSYFIAFALSAGERSLPFLIMDDPLQFMDEINVLGFADLCRHLRANRQILVTTHDRRFARLLDRKLRPRLQGETSRQIEFTTWERSGPRLAPTLHEPEHVPDILAAAT